MKLCENCKYFEAKERNERSQLISGYCEIKSYATTYPKNCCELFKKKHDEAKSLKDLGYKKEGKHYFAKQVNEIFQDVIFVGDSCYYKAVYDINGKTMGMPFTKEELLATANEILNEEEQ